MRQGEVIYTHVLERTNAINDSRKKKKSAIHKSRLST